MIKAITRKINNLNINCGRITTDANSDSYIHDNQINTAIKILSRMSEKTTRSHHVILLAQMQSGKTGVCNAVVNLLNSDNIGKTMGIKKCIFVTGMNDCGLKNQTIERLFTQTNVANINNTYTGYSNANENVNYKFFVMKNNDLLRYEGNLENTLLIIDESHYGSHERQVLTQFLTNHEIDWKDNTNLIVKNTYILSVSATPFNEIVSDKANAKSLIELPTDNSYIGVKDYLDNDLIKEANKDDFATGEIFNMIKDARKRMSDNNESGAIIIRTRKFDTLLGNDYIQNNFNILEIVSQFSHIDYENFNAELGNLVEKNIDYNEGRRSRKVKPLLILIKGAFRAGITIPSSYKDYIYMIYDYSITAQTTAQALLGRMCGYRNIANNKYLNNYFYVNKKFADMYGDWSVDITDRTTIPYNTEKWAWVDDNYDGGEIASKSNGNFAINLTDEEIKNLYNELYGHKSKTPLMEEIFPKILKKKKIKMKYDYMMETLMNGKNNYKDSSKDKRFDSFSKDLVVFPFRPEKIIKFQFDTNRDYLTSDDLGKTCISLVLDCDINIVNGEIEISGNKRLLVYYVIVAKKAKLASRECMYQVHKDTMLI